MFPRRKSREMIEGHSAARPFPKALFMAPAHRPWKIRSMSPARLTGGMRISLQFTGTTRRSGSIRGHEESSETVKQHPQKCPECGGSLKFQTITHTQPWGTKLCRFEQAPALVCTQCGYVWLEAAVSQLMDKIIWEHRRPAKYEKVPVFSLEMQPKS